MMELNKRLNKYIFANIFAMLGMSLYFLADTFFISVSAGANGLTALNLILPIYSLMGAIGAMFGIGSAIRFALYINTDKDRANAYFSKSIIMAISLGLIYAFIFVFFAKPIMGFLKADEVIMPLGVDYLRNAMIFTPFFMLNHCFLGVVRNDLDPSLSMTATVVSSLANVLLDYIFMFPLGLGFKGAALATGISPILSIIVLSFHFRKSTNRVRFKMMIPDFKYIIEVCKVGISSFIGEISGGITTLSFNYILLGLGGNIHVAAYGVVSNVVIVINAIFNGIGQGLQPLASEYFGINDLEKTNLVLKRTLAISFSVFIIIMALILLFNKEIVMIFNSENSLELANIAEFGLVIYTLGFIVANINIIKSSFYSSICEVHKASAISILRGVVLIVFFAFLLSFLFGIKGVWFAFICAEITTFIIVR